jgi:RNA polymerase sigma factor (sigma-70 family)
MDDLEFVQRCVKGDQRIFNEFLRKYSRLIYSYIYSVLKLKGTYQSNQDHIDNIFQGIFVLLTQNNFKKLKSFRAKNGCSLASWLRQVVINYSIDYLRKQRTLVSLDEENDEGSSLKDILSDDSVSVIEKIESEERIAHLRDCIDRLDTDEKYFLELHIHRDLNLEQLKRHFRVSRPAIDMRKKRIIDKLKDCFKSKGFMLDF